MNKKGRRIISGGLLIDLVVLRSVPEAALLAIWLDVALVVRALHAADTFDVFVPAVETSLAAAVPEVGLLNGRRLLCRDALQRSKSAERCGRAW
jgi:hypothetical protein